MTDEPDVLEDDEFTLEIADDQTERAFDALADLENPTVAARIAQFFLVAAAIAISAAHADDENGDGENETAAPDECDPSN